jgi:hypothetical protein
MNKIIDTLLSSQKTPAHQLDPLGSEPGATFSEYVVLIAESTSARPTIPSGRTSKMPHLPGLLPHLG